MATSCQLSWLSGSAAYGFCRHGRVSEQGQGSGLVQGRSLYSPRHAEGAGATNTDPPPQRHRRRQEGGPLWLQVPGYFRPVMLCQDHLLVSTTTALVSTRTGFPPHYRSDVMLMDSEDSEGQHFLTAVAALGVTKPVLACCGR